jgi:hypothetical protein
MSNHDALGSGEFPNVVVASLFAVETGLNAITFALNLRKGKIDFRGYARYIEASDV